MISVSNLSQKIGGAPVLTDISLELPKGELIALIGPNGAGKSTLLSLIARLIPLQTGQIMVDDLAVGECRSGDLARKLAILPQFSTITPRLTTRELVSFGRYPYHKGRPTADDRIKVETALEQFDLLGFANRQLDSLSGGQRQRALVAMTFAQETDYVLLDEPLNNLDIAASRALMRLLRKLVEDFNRTVVIVLHDINYASAYADRVIALKNGRLCCNGTPSAVVTTQMLGDVFETDAEVHLANGKPIVQV